MSTTLPALTLTTHSRLPRVAGWLGASRMSGLATLASLGVASALLTLFVDLDVKLPGHAILRSIAPTALGLALVPRRNAGAVMAGFAGLTALCHATTYEARGFGSIASLVLAGDRKSTRLNSSHLARSRMPSSA